jgi:hypothetical protein
MSNSEQPREADQTLYQRDKTAKEPKVSADIESTPKPKPKPKLRKAFVAKKLVKITDKPQEYRARHIRVSTLESANIFRQALIDFQKELASEPIEDPDKPFHDQAKVENYFIRIAKKYSTCSTKALSIPEPIKTKLGYHIILSCENRDRVEKEKIITQLKPQSAPTGTNIPS